MAVYVEYPHTTSSKNRDEHVTSTNKKVMECCPSFKEGIAKLVNKIWYLYEQNRKKGINHVLISPKTLESLIGRSGDSVTRYVNGAVKAEMVTFEKVRDAFHKMRYKFYVTDKLRIIKTCGTLADDDFPIQPPQDVPNFYAQIPQLAEKTPQNAGNTPPSKPLFSAGLKTVLEPLYLSIPIKRLNKEKQVFKEAAIESSELPLSSFQTEGLEFLKSIQELNQNLPIPNLIDEQSIFKAYETLKKSHFGTLDKAKQYLASFASNLFLMGKKPTKRGHTFHAKIGYILSTKTIEQYFAKKGPFNVWIPKESKPISKNETSDQAVVPTFHLAEALEKAHSFIDRVVKAHLYESLGVHKYISWIDKTGFIALGIKGGEPQFHINGNYAKDYVTTHYREQLKAAFAHAEGIC